MKKTAILLSLLVLTLLSAPAWAQTFGAVLSGDQEVPPADLDGFGSATVTFSADRTQVTFDVTVSNIGTNITQAHIHRGAAGVNGPIVIGFASAADNFVDGRKQVTVSGVDPALSAEIIGNPANFYVNVHTSQFPGGAVRGQLSAFSGTTFVGDLRAERETPTPGPPGGTGSFVVSFNEARNEVTWAIGVAGIGSNIILSHIHRGAEGVAGPVEINFNPTYVNGQASGVVSGVDPALANEIINNPAGFYVNVHTSEFPAGAVRGQLLVANQDNTAFLPVVGRVSNATETFVTDVRIFNPSFTTTSVVTVEFFPAGGSRQFRSLQIAPRGTAVLNDIVGGAFATTGIGGARISSSGPVIAGARIFSDRRPTDGGTIGQFFPASQPMRRGVLTQVAQNSATRTNIGLFNQNDVTVTVRLELRDEAGTLVGSQILNLAPRSFRQDAINVHIAAATNLSDGTVTFDASAPIMVYASVVDNVTTDPSAVLPIPDPNVPTTP